jgi:hypothetical protein
MSVRVEMAMRAPPVHRSFLVASVESCPTFWYSEGGQKEQYTRKKTDSGDDEPDPCLRRHYLLTLPSSPVCRVC